MEIELIVPGEPRPWTVYTKQGNPTSGFNRMQAWQEMIGIEAKKAMSGRKPIDGAVRMDIIFSRVMLKAAPKVPDKPKRYEDLNHFRRRVVQAELKRSKWLDAHLIKRPDLDNYRKAFSDALQGIVYHDDSQIIGGGGSKDYAPFGREGYTWAIIRSHD